ncbi:MAG TPA: hypothetical protein VF328_10830 [Mycobacterium sp.]
MRPSSCNNRIRPEWDINSDPWSAAQDVFDTELIDAVAKGSTDQTDDLDVAKAPARVVHDESRDRRVAALNTSGHLVRALL